MKQCIKILSDFIFSRTRKAKMANYSILGLLLLYVAIIIYPDFLFGHSFKYKNFRVYSTQALDDNIQEILKNAEKNLMASEINDFSIIHNIYLCNNYVLYSFLAPFSQNAFACNYPLISNIFVAYSAIDKNEAYINQEIGQTSRLLNELIAHEATHTLIEKKLGFWKYRTLDKWKNEGYCEYIGFNKPIKWKDAKKYIKYKKEDYNPEALYYKYHYSVSFLKEIEKMNLEEIMKSKLTFEEVLEKIEKAKGIEE